MERTGMVSNEYDEIAEIYEKIEVAIRFSNFE